MANLDIAAAIVHEWQTLGFSSNPSNVLVYKHPEFIFRLSGDWKGWNDFLNIKLGSPHYAENEQADLIENLAWSLYLSNHHTEGVIH